VGKKEKGCELKMQKKYGKIWEDKLGG